ncbi:Autophagy-related protein 2 [Golovinomyces cichoracearum]|uniref:Autophagy-related protein 2 n=1 Tax=Golovinomyces cichoracearum TaxID=62708 RepID=A0A420I990_9PEZI|nr:Autophagy-related protein 2 [Golovinomyces cichoracearum]
MTSYFQSYFRTSSMPKRLLQYAISRLDVIDTDALDLENLDIVWGKNSVFEFKNVGLRLRKIEALLQLPSFLEFSKANILLLRLIIPVDIYNSPIKVEVVGLESQLQLKQCNDLNNINSDCSQEQNSQAKVSKILPPTGNRSDPWGKDNSKKKEPSSASNLAQSFLETEPEEEKTELEAVLAETQGIGSSSLLSDDGEINSGTGTALALPAFMSRFLQGIIDRLQIKIEDVDIILNIDIPNEIPKLSPPSDSTDNVSVQIRIKEINIKGVDQELRSYGVSDNSQPNFHQVGSRLVCLSQIRGYLISESGFFTALASSCASSLSNAESHEDLFKHFDKAASSNQANERILSRKSTESCDLKSPSRSKSLCPQDTSIDNSQFGIDPGSENKFNKSETKITHVDTPEQSHLNDNCCLSQSMTLDTSYASKNVSSIFSHRVASVQSDLERPKLSAYHKYPSVDISNQNYFLPMPSPEDPLHLSNSRSSRAHDSFPPHSLISKPCSNDSFEAVTQEENADTSASTAAEKEHLENESFKLNIDEDLSTSLSFNYGDRESLYMSAVSYKYPLCHDPENLGKQSEKSDNIPSCSYSKISLEDVQCTENPPKSRLEFKKSKYSTDKDLSCVELNIDKNVKNLRQEESSNSSSDSKTAQVSPIQKFPETYEFESKNCNVPSRRSRKIFSIDTVRIRIPGNHTERSIDEAVSEYLDSDSNFNLDNQEKIPAVDIPGSFSRPISGKKACSEKFAKADKSGSDTQKTTPTLNPNEVRINLGILNIEFDVSVGRLILKLASLFRDQLIPQLHKNSAHTVNSSSEEAALKLKIEEVSLTFMEHLDSILTNTIPSLETTSSSRDILLQTKIIGLRLDSRTNSSGRKTTILLRKFNFGYSDETILSFDSSLDMRSSERDLKASAGIEIFAKLKQTPSTTRFEMSTLPIKISIKLQKIDETFSWLGGLSSVLNLGSSIASGASAIASNSCMPKTRGVRFETQILPEDSSVLVQNKSDIRIGGCRVDLIGSKCGLRLTTSPVKIVSRDEGIGISIQKIKLSGPYLYSSSDSPAINVEITSTRIEILSSPKDSDLDRLLSLITPSKSKYGQDDDILLDTLICQRNKGAVLRLNIDSLKICVTRIHELNYLPELVEEVSKLATVAKYLPDDDRSSLLSLILVRGFDLEAESGHAFGNIKLFLSDLEIAQIPTPALLAFGVYSISLTRNDSEIILESTADHESQDLTFRGPVAMARIIGNEMEPVVRIKLWNIKFEYHLPTMMSLFEFIETFTTLDVSPVDSSSVGTSESFTLGQKEKIELTTILTGVRGSSAKPLTIDIVLHNCILGLNPLGLPSKVLLTLTEAHAKAIFLKNENVNASVEFRKTSILVIDDVANLVESHSASKRRQYLDVSNNQATRLCSMGFVSVGYISSVKVIVFIEKTEGERAIDVEVCDDLLVLESCADSTQTLMAVMNALTPTPPPSKEAKYRTKVVPVDDLLASLSTDAFGTAEGHYNFDDDFGLIENIEANFHPIDLGEESEDFSVSSQYYEKKDEIFYDEAGPSSLITRETQDGVLLENFLVPDEPEDDLELEFKENYFEASSILGGDVNQWDSARNTYEKPNNSKPRKNPLNIRVRDFHITWNLFDGYDWQQTRDTITKAVQNMTSRVIEKRSRSDKTTASEYGSDDDEGSVIEDFLFNSIYIGVPANRDPRELASAINQELNDNTTDTDSVVTTHFSSTTGPAVIRKQKANKLLLGRSKNHKITFDLRGVSIDFVAFSPEIGETQSSVNIRVHDFEIFDHVPSSTWRKFATYMQDAGQRETDSNMIQIEILNVKPVAELAASETVLKATLLPLRLHIDQDALDFILRFFEFKDDSTPIPASSGEEAFIQRVEVESIKIKLDFKPKRVNYAGLRSGHSTELMNFLVLDGADMELRHTIIYGISGFQKLGRCLNDIWMPDIKQNQLPGILAGLAPVRPLVNVGDGFRHLVIVPIHEYKKDGRIIRGISKGATVFAKTTGTELVKLGAKMAVGIQTVLQGAEGFLSPQNTLKRESNTNRESRQISLYANQPIGVLQGLRGGYSGLQKDLVLTKDAIIAVSDEAMESGTAMGTFKAVGRYAPTVILRPAIGVVKASGQILMGATNSLDPLNLQRAEAVSIQFMKITKIFPKKHLINKISAEIQKVTK